MASATEINAFWQETLARAAQLPLAATVEPVPAAVPYHQFRVTYQSLGDVRVVGILALPIMPRTENGIPAIVTFPGYGGWEFGQMLSESQRGYAVFQVYPRWQGESGAASDGSHLLRGIDAAEGYNYQGVYVDAVRAVDYLCSHPEIDAARIGAMGTSQGGAIAIAATALDSRIGAGVAHLPYFCDMRNNSAFRGTEMQQAEHLAVFDYFDPARLAERITVPFLLSSGGRDATSPAATIRAVFDHLQGLKALFADPELEHTSSVEFQRLSWDWIERHL